MRRFLLPATLLFLTAAATTGYAGAGLPKILAADVGTYRAEVSADSLPVLANGTTFTVAVKNLAPDAFVTLKLIGPGGEMVEVPLKPLKVVEGPAAHGGGDDHGAKADDHGASPAKDDHHAPAAPAKDDHHAPAAPAKDDHHAPAAPAKDDHHAPAAPAKDDHGAADGGHGDDGAPAADSYNARGRASLKTPGHWTAVLALPDDHGRMHETKSEFEVVPGGPNRIFLGFTGALMGGTVIYSLMQRRRQPQ